MWRNLLWNISNLISAIENGYSNFHVKNTLGSICLSRISYESSLNSENRVKVLLWI